MQFHSDNNLVDISLLAPSRARVGERVPITILVRNGQPRTIGLASVGPEITFDILVSRDDVLVWQRLYGQTIALALQVRMLQPGESFELKDVWHANVEAGHYEVVGRILTDADPLETPPVSVEIVGRGFGD
jgi:hypothetical protein